MRDEVCQAGWAADLKSALFELLVDEGSLRYLFTSPSKDVFDLAGGVRLPVFDTLAGCA